VSRPEPGPPLCGLNPPYSLYKNNYVIPWKIQQFYMDTPQHHQFSISVQILNKHQLQPTILHLHPCLLHRSPPNIIYFLICHRIFPNYRFCPLNFNHSYLINRNSESGDSCAKILRIISSFYSIYSYAYDCCIYVIVCLSIKRIILEPTYEDFQKQVYEDFKMKYTRTLIFSFQSNEASALDHFAPITFLSIL
jgi:hypothetical protein